MQRPGSFALRPLNTGWSGGRAWCSSAGRHAGRTRPGRTDRWRPCFRRPARPKPGSAWRARRLRRCRPSPGAARATYIPTSISSLRSGWMAIKQSRDCRTRGRNCGHSGRCRKSSLLCRLPDCAGRHVGVHPQRIWSACSAQAADMDEASLRWLEMAAICAISAMRPPHLPRGHPAPIPFIVALWQGGGHYLTSPGRLDPHPAPVLRG